MGVGQLRYLWIDDAGPISADLADGTVLMTYTLRAIGAAGSYNALITDMPTPRDAFNSSFSQVPVTSLGVTIEIVPLSLTTVGPIAPLCPNQLTVNLPFTGAVGNPTNYVINYDAAAQTAGFNPMVSGTLSVMTGYIVLNVPANLPHGVYNGTLVVSNQYGCMSVGYPFAITIDQMPPTASNPAPISQACMTVPLPNPSLVIDEMDNCPGPLAVVWVGDAENGGSGCGITPKIITRTYQVTDVAGNTTTVTQTITMLDNLPPFLNTPPTLPNTWYPTEAAALAAAMAHANANKNDICTLPMNITVMQGSAPSYVNCVVTFHLILKDGCNNAASFNYTTTIDGAPPVATSGPIDDCYEQSEDTQNQYYPYQNAVNAALLATTATDDCDQSLTYTAAYTGYDCALTITVTVKDDCGKIGTAVYDTRVENDAPNITSSPLALNGQCFTSVHDAFVAAINATVVGDDCPGLIQLDTMFNEGCPGSVTVFATDYCGNPSMITYTNIYIDTQDPVATEGMPVETCFKTLQAAATYLAHITDLVDDCTSDSLLIVSALNFNGPNAPVFVPGEVACEGSVILIFTDHCGHSDTATYDYITIDNTVPTAAPLPALQYNCVSEVAAPDSLLVISMDNCGFQSINWVADSLPTTCPGTGTRTYRVTDCAGNTVDVVQNIIIMDQIAPTWLVAAGAMNTTCVCGDTVCLAYAQSAQIGEDVLGHDADGPVPDTDGAEDNCGEYTLIRVPGAFVANQNCAIDHIVGTYTNTWYAVDGCGVPGNQSLPYIQTITIIDNVAPTWMSGIFDNMANSFSHRVQVQCSDTVALDAAMLYQPIANDNCSMVTYTKVNGPTYVPAPTCVNGNLGYYVTEWRATDGCGNTSIPFFHYIDIYDNTAPVWMTAAAALNINIDCDDAQALSYYSSLAPVLKADGCSAVTIMHTPGTFVAGACTQSGTITNTWVATDACGNLSGTFSQVITLIDSKPPTFDSLCQFMPLTLTTTGGYTCPLTATITGLVVNQIIGINTTWNVAGFAVPTLAGCISDNCAAPSAIIIKVVSIQNVYNPTACDRTITVSFQLSDPCGNVQPVLFVCVYHIIDNTAPVIFCAQRMGVNPVLLPCYQSVAAAEADALESISPCDQCTTEYEDLDISVATIIDNFCSAAVTVTVTDCAGNSANYTFVTRIDGTGPTLTKGTIPGCFVDVTTAEAAAMAATTSTDNCPGGLSISASTAGTCPASITVTVTDGCGNPSSVVYNNICIGAGNAVTITTPASNQTVDCSNEASGLAAWLANRGGAIATGSGVVWTYTPDPIVFGPVNCMTHSKSVTVTFKATDNCGYMATTTAIFTVQDLTPPSVSAVAATNLTCSTLIPAPNTNLVTGATDNCDASLTIALFANTSNGGAGCPNSPLVLLRTYSVTDDYCNTTYVTHTINIVDNVPPTFTAPGNITINVNANCAYDASIGVTGDGTNEMDNCSTGLNAVYTDVITSGNQNQNKFIIIRTWRLVDNCGNQAQPLTQVITVKDVTPPTITCPTAMYQPGGVVENNSCAWVGTGLAPTFADNCPGSTLSYTLSGFFSGNSSGTGSVDGRLFLEGETTVTYTVTDGVGNTASCSFVLTVNCTNISGRILWEHVKTTGVKDATVRLTLGMLNLGSTLSDVAGNYSLTTNVLGIHTITPVKNINRFNGVTAADATAIQQHIAGTNVITDPYKKVAADVNRNGFITSQDANLILQGLAGNMVALNVFNVFWRFVPTTHVFIVTPPSSVPPFPENIMVNVTGPDVTGQDFYGMKIGDVNGSANPSMAPTGTPLIWMVKDQALQAGTEVALNFTSTNFTNLAAVQFGLDFDPAYLQFVGFESMDAITLTADNFGDANAAIGELRFVWAQALGATLSDGTPVMKAKFKVLKGGQKLSQVVQLDEQILPGQAYTENLVASDVRVVFVESVATADPTSLGKPQLQLFQNNPNPFAGATTIGFILPDACEAQLRVMDVSGRELSNHKRHYTAGYHEIDFRMDNAAAYGVLYYELSTPFGKLTKKMVTVK